MPNQPKTALSALAFVVAMTTGCTGAPNANEMVPPGDATCRVVEHGPTGPEPTVNVGWTVRVCDDGTRHVWEWDVATGDVFATYVVTP